MDAGAFWQENKRWVVGATLGVIVYFLGKSIIGSMWDPDPVRTAARKVTTSERGQALYDQAAKQAATAEGESLEQELQRLKVELVFTPDERFLLGGKGMAPEDYLIQTGRAVKQSLVQEANRLDCQLLDKDLSWPVAADEIRSVLFGLNLIDEAVRRLFAAHRAVRQQDPDAMGLRAIQSFKLEERRTARGIMPRTGRPGDVDLRDHLTQEKVAFHFQSDSATALLFLRACRQPGRTLVIEDLSMTKPDRDGEPVTVKGTLLGVAFKEETN